MTDFLVDTFTDTDNVLLENHTSDNGKTWSLHTPLSGVGNSAKIKSNRLYDDDGGQGKAYYSSAAPATPEYDVVFSLYARSLTTNNRVTIVGGRYSTGVNTGYQLYMTISSSSQIQFSLYRVSAGSLMLLGSTYTLTGVSAGNSYVVKLELNNAAKKVYIDGVERISDTNNDITSAGVVVVGIPTASSTAGLDIDSINAGRLVAELVATLPMPTLSVIGATGEVGVVALTLPMFQLAVGENALIATLPALTIAINGATGNVGQVVAGLPMPVLAINGGAGNTIDAVFPLLESSLDGYSAVIDAIFPLLGAEMVGVNGAAGAIDAAFFLLQAQISGGVDAIDAEFPFLSAEINGAVGINGAIDARFALLASDFIGATLIIGSIDAGFPLLSSLFTGVQTTVGSVDAAFPRLKSLITGRLGSAGAIDARLPILSSEFIGWTAYSGSIEATFYLLSGSLAADLSAAPNALPIAKVLAMNLRHGAVSEFENFNFNSVALFNGQPLAANASGIHVLRTDRDGTLSIAARARSGQNDLSRAAGSAASVQLKRPTDAYVSYQSLSDARFSIVVEDVLNDYLLPGEATEIKTHKVDLGRGLKTRYVQWEIANRDGQALDIDDVMISAEVLKRRV